MDMRARHSVQIKIWLIGWLGEPAAVCPVCEGANCCRQLHASRQSFNILFNFQYSISTVFVKQFLGGEHSFQKNGSVEPFFVSILHFIISLQTRGSFFALWVQRC